MLGVQEFVVSSFLGCDYAFNCFSNAWCRESDDPNVSNDALLGCSKVSSFIRYQAIFPGYSDGQLDLSGYLVLKYHSFIECLSSS